MTRPRNDSTDDLLRHIERGPGRDPDGYARTYERLRDGVPDVQNDQPSESGRR